MALKIKIDPIERVTAASIRSDLDLPEQRRAAGEFARQGIAEADQVNRRVLGRVPPRTITVDGRQGAPLESVKPDGGSIIVEYELVGDVLRWIAGALRERSPVVSGKYRDSHTLFADGRETKIGEQIPSGVTEFVFLNTQPYSRKIEIAKTKAGRAFVIRVPNRIYERTAKDARGRFSNMAKISFAWRAPYVSGRAGNKASNRYPAILVMMNA